jgi:hypothetical protein
MAIQTSWDSTTQFESSQAMPSHLGDESPRVMNANEAADEDGEVLLLETQWAHLRIAPIFSLGLKNELEECGRE